MYTRFTASQWMEMVVPPAPVPIQHYLRQPRRLVHALADASRLEYLREDCFRLKMRPLTFMNLNIQPTVDLKVKSQPDSTLRLRSTGCQIRGVEYINQRFSLNLFGRLSPHTIGGVTYLKGIADLEVKVEIPAPLNLTPSNLLEATGNGLLNSVLLTIKHRLMHNLVQDYRRWANDAEAEEPRNQSLLNPQEQTI